jgi:hypothetical protein
MILETVPGLKRLPILDFIPVSGKENISTS